MQQSGDGPSGQHPSQGCGFVESRDAYVIRYHVTAMFFLLSLTLLNQDRHIAD